MDKIYASIDLKSFYASVECMERNLDPLDTYLVVADNSRTDKTICLAVSPALKRIGVPGRPRLFEVKQKLKIANLERQKKLKQKIILTSTSEKEIKETPNKAIDIVIATPQMAKYIQFSQAIYGVYVKYFDPADIHVYSIDEVFIDMTNYLKKYDCSPRLLVKKILLDILKTTGITATAGIGTNLYLAKVAMDIMAKHILPDQDGVCIAMLNEKMYRKYLWHHKPLHDFWRVGKGYVKRLEKLGLYTMGDIAKCSVGDVDSYYNEKLLYDTFGINAELLIDHAWGKEPCTIKHIKAYKPLAKSVGSGQVLHDAYDYQKTKIVLKEMLEQLALDLVEKGLVTNQITIGIGYDKDNVTTNFEGEICVDSYHRLVPKPAHGSVNLPKHTASALKIKQYVLSLFNQIIDKKLLVRRLNISANHIQYRSDVQNQKVMEQLNLFSNYDDFDENLENENKILDKEYALQQATLQIKQKYGRNSIVKAMNLQIGATGMERNDSIGGHKA